MRQKKGKYSYAEDENVYKIGRIRFFGGNERQYIKGIDSEALLREVLQARVDTKNFTQPISIEKEYKGHLFRFTQNQMRALLLHTEEIK